MDDTNTFPGTITASCSANVLESSKPPYTTGISPVQSTGSFQTVNMDFLMRKHTVITIFLS